MESLLLGDGQTQPLLQGRLGDLLNLPTLSLQGRYWSEKGHGANEEVRCST